MNHYGDVALNQNHWVIRCEPHVRARLKRVFPRAPQQAADYIALSNTPENARELEWFLQRYPMRMTTNLELLLGEAARGHRNQEVRLADLLARRAPPAVVNLAKPARDYQAVVPQHLDVKGGLLLGDEVGVGKTVSGIACLTLPEALPAVIVVPPHLVGHWAEFIAAFSPQLRVHCIRKGRPYDLIGKPRSRTLWKDAVPDVLIVSYFMLRGWADTLGELCRTAIYEECQQLRNSGSVIYQACAHLSGKVRRRLGLSATPIYNYGSEFFWVCDVLQPGALGTREEFVREWCGVGTGDKARLDDPEQFGAYLRREGIMLRRSRKDVGRELPPVTKIVHTVDTDEAVLEALTSDAVKLAQVILAHAENFRGERMQASGEFDLVMRQATGVAKAPYVAQFVRMLLESGEKVLLFGWHKAVYRIWRELLADFKPAFYTGAQSPREKEASKKAFIDGETNLLIVSLRAGAGTDGLQKVCRTVVIGELDWSQGIHVQCVGRVDRDGQPEPVTAYFLVAEDGSDPIVSEVCGVKRAQSEPVLNPGGALVERIDTGEHSLRQLARDFLTRRGVEVPAAPAIASIGSEGARP